MRPSRYMILQARAEARAYLYANFCEYADMEEAIAPLREYAIRRGIVDQLGPRATMDLIEEPFRIACSGD